MPRKQTPADGHLSSGQADAEIAKATSDLLPGDDSGVTSFHLKQAQNPSDSYPLRLTHQQRGSMIHCTRIKRKLKERLKEAGEGTQVVSVTQKELDHLNLELGQAAIFAPSPDKKRLVAVQHRVAELIAQNHAGLVGKGMPKARKTAPRKAERTVKP